MIVISHNPICEALSALNDRVLHIAVIDKPSVVSTLQCAGLVQLRKFGKDLRF